MFKGVFCCVLLCLSVSISQQSVLQQISASNYFVSLIPKPFLGALTICQEFGFKLATVPNAEIQNAINATTHNVTWLGGTYLTYNGIFAPKWTWADGDDEFSYTNWGEGEPNYNEEKLNCLGMKSDGLWFVESCETEQNFICSKK